jgi:hypothetical protein
LANAGLTTYQFSADKWNAKSGIATWEADDYGQRYVYATSGANRPRRFNGDYGNSLVLLGPNSISGTLDPLFKPEEAWNIDIKIDDGKPATGKIVVASTPVTTLGMEPCADVTSSATLTANYLLTSSDKNCGLFFRNAF